MRILMAILLRFLLGVCRGNSEPRERQENDIRETVFRWQFDHDAAAHQKAILSRGEKDQDPSDDLMKRFTGNKPQVRNALNAPSSKEPAWWSRRTRESLAAFFGPAPFAGNPTLRSK